MTAVLLCLTVLLPIGVGGASARSAHVYPSARQVRAARARAHATAAQVAALEKQYQAASARLVVVEQEVSAAAQAYAVAEGELTARTVAAAAAGARADAAAHTADAAQLAVRRDAASLYEQGGTLGQLGALMSSGSPQQLADEASGLDAVSQRWSSDVVATTTTAAIATQTRRTAELARAQQQQATDAAHSAELAAQAKVAQATALAATIQRQQQATVARLARLRHTTARLEKARQEGLAAARARAAAARAAARASWYGGAILTSGGSASLSAAQRNPRAVAQRLMPAFGFGGSQWGCLDSLWNGESGWRWSAANPSSGAYGIPQSLPASKMGAAGPDWLTNPVTQIRWGLGYIRGAYGSPCAAWSAWLSRSPHWY